MPFIDINSRLGINADRWWLIQSGPQPYKQAAACHAFEKEWLECAHGIGQIRAAKECKLEYEDFIECMSHNKKFARMNAISEQRAKLIKEGKYTPPPCHKGDGNY